MITHVGVKFDGTTRTYTYLCNLQNVAVDDTLLVKVRGNFELVRCVHVSHGKVPPIATKHILDKIYPRKYKDDKPHIEDCLIGAL